MDVWAQLGLTLVGALVTWFFARRYYVRASNAQQQENDSLRKAVSLVLKALEEAGIEFTHEADGSIRGIVRNASASIGARSSLQTEAVVEELLSRAALRADLDRREKESTNKTPLEKL